MSLINYATSIVMSCIASLGMGSAVAKKLKVRAKQYDVSIERNATFTTAEGIRLSAEIFHPKGSAKTPTILVRAPISHSPNVCLLIELIGRMWAERGYTAVIQGTRGRYNSGGDFYPMYFERNDGIETLQWLKKQSWYNGQIGGWGGSAFGQTEWAIADQRDPGFSSMEIYFASTDFHKMFYQGNAFSLYSAIGWTLRSHGKTSDESEWPTTKRIFKAANGWPMRDADKRALNSSVLFFQDWIKHKNSDDYWRQVDGTNRAATAKCPMLLIAGWYDPFLVTQLADFQRISERNDVAANQSKLVIGPWSHARDVKLPNVESVQKFRPFSVASSIPWFDETLQHANAQPKSEISIFTMGTNCWRTEHEWPLARTRYVDMYLGSQGTANNASGTGKLDFKPTSESNADKFTYDPNHPVITVGGAMIGDAAGMYLQNSIEKRDDVLVYTSEPLTNNTEVTGPVKVVLYVSTDAKSTDFTAKLVDVAADGRAYNLCDGILRRTYGKQNELNLENQPQEIEIDLTATSNVFLKGHRIRLEISSSNFPRFDRNPNTGGDPATETHPVIAHQCVYTGGSHRSRLTIPLIQTQ